MKLKRLLELAGIQLDEDVMTKEAFKDIQKTVALAFSKLKDNGKDENTARTQIVTFLNSEVKKYRSQK